MKLYYTGADGFEQAQTSSLLSLGGYPSSSQLPQGIDKLFGSISQKDLREGSVITKALSLKNQTGELVSGAKIYYKNDSEFPVASYRMAIVIMGADDCSKSIMEKIANASDSPVDAIFIDNVGSDNALTFPDLAIDQHIGVWIERRVNNIKGQESISCEFLLNAFDAVETEHVSTITLTDASIGGEYFTIDTISNKYVVWFSDGVATMPTIANSYELLIISFAGTETASELATKVNDKLKSIVEFRGEILSEVSTNIVTITNKTLGAPADSIVSVAAIEYAITTQGVSNNVEDLEDVEFILEY